MVLVAADYDEKLGLEIKTLLESLQPHTYVTERDEVLFPIRTPSNVQQAITSSNRIEMHRLGTAAYCLHQ